MKILIWLLCAYLGNSVDGARILGIFHVPTRSHHIIGSSLLKGLAAKGHDVTMVSPYPLKKAFPNYRDIYIEGVNEYMDGMREKFAEVHNTSAWETFSKIGSVTYNLAEMTINSTGVQNLLNSNEKFDVIIIEPFSNEAFFGLGHHYNAPVIVVSTGSSQMGNAITGNVAPYSFVPHLMTSYTDKMTFIERLINTLVAVGYQLHRDYVQMPEQVKLYRKHFKNGPEVEELVKDVALVLYNSHVVLETPRPYLPNMISIGGIHIEEPKKLTEDLQTFLDNAKEGVIYFSLGSNLRSAHLPEDKRKEIMMTFAKLPQKVLWKFEEENLPGKPDNVKISKWFPQNDILAHPNVKLFITHGGLLSSTEAVYRGVPVIGVPFYGDQRANTATFVTAGYGLQLDFSDLTEESFSKVIKEIINNPKYRENVKKRSAIIRDQPMKPLDKGIFWIEHVIRHKGGKHLRSASVDISWPQYLLLDVVAFIVTVLVLFSTGIYLIVRCLCCSKRSKSIENIKPKKKKLN